VSPLAEPKGPFVEIVVVAATGAALSLAALAVSVLLARRQGDLEAVQAVLARRQADLQERVGALEETRRAEQAEAGRRARVTARFDRSFRTLHLINDGPAVARGVTVELRPIGAGQPLALDLAALPADLRPGKRLFLDAQQPSSPDGVASMTVTVRWTDDAGAQDATFVFSTQF
jgi:hypothetical protein